MEKVLVSLPTSPSQPPYLTPMKSQRPCQSCTNLWDVSAHRCLYTSAPYPQPRHLTERKVSRENVGDTPPPPAGMLLPTRETSESVNACTQLPSFQPRHLTVRGVIREGAGASIPPATPTPNAPAYKRNQWKCWCLSPSPTLQQHLPAGRVSREGVGENGLHGGHRDGAAALWQCTLHASGLCQHQHQLIGCGHKALCSRAVLTVLHHTLQTLEGRTAPRQSNAGLMPPLKMTSQTVHDGLWIAYMVMCILDAIWDHLFRSYHYGSGKKCLSTLRNPSEWLVSNSM